MDKGNLNLLPALTDIRKANINAYNILICTQTQQVHYKQRQTSNNR